MDLAEALAALDERDKDLRLSAEFGQMLLRTNDQLTADLGGANERIEELTRDVAAAEERAAEAARRRAAAERRTSSFADRLDALQATHAEALVELQTLRARPAPAPAPAPAAAPAAAPVQEEEQEEDPGALLAAADAQLAAAAAQSAQAAAEREAADASGRLADAELRAEELAAALADERELRAAAKSRALAAERKCEQAAAAVDALRREAAELRERCAEWERLAARSPELELDLVEPAPLGPALAAELAQATAQPVLRPAEREAVAHAVGDSDERAQLQAHFALTLAAAQLRLGGRAGGDVDGQELYRRLIDERVPLCDWPAWVGRALSVSALGRPVALELTFAELGVAFEPSGDARFACAVGAAAAGESRVTGARVVAAPEVVSGFLCPQCREDLGAAEALIEHYRSCSGSGVSGGSGSGPGSGLQRWVGTVGGAVGGAVGAVGGAVERVGGAVGIDVGGAVAKPASWLRGGLQWITGGGGEAAAEQLEAGMLLIAVNGGSVDGMAFDDVQRMLGTLGRPIVLRFRVSR